jgi:hypothetical protein
VANGNARSHGQVDPASSDTLQPPQESPRMSQYVNAEPVRRHVVSLADGGTLMVTQLQGTGADSTGRCIHRVTTDAAGRLRSDIVYFYDSTVKAAEVEADFSLLTGGGLVSMSQLHHTESMLNRGPKTARRA